MLGSRLCALAAAGLLLAAVTPEAEAGESLVGAVSAVDLGTPSGGGEMKRFGSGGALSLMYLCDEGDDELSGGFEGRTTFLRGREGERLYDLGLSILGSTSLRHGPGLLLEVGLDLAATSIPEDSGHVARGVNAGLHGDVGVHGFAGDSFYYRGQVGYVGAGIGGVEGSVSIGWIFD